MKFLAAAAFAATVLFAQPAQAATMIEFDAYATGTTTSRMCMTGPSCDVATDFAAAFSRVATLGAFVDGAAFFQLGSTSNGGLLSGTVIDLGGGRFSGVNFSYAQLRQCTTTPCLNFATTLTASSFSVRQFVPGLTSAVPEPGTWATMLIGFGAIGGTMRRARRGGRAILAAA